MASWQHHWLSGWEESTMALTNPTVVGTVNPGSVAHASDTITTTADIPAGATVILGWAANANRTPTSITGTAGLAFQQDSGRADTAANGGSIWIYSARAGALIAAGSTIVVNFTTGTIATAGQVGYFEGAAASLWFDVAANNFATTGTAWSTGTTATRGQANEISVAFAFETGAPATTSTTTAPATELNEIQSGGRNLTFSYEQHTSTGTSSIAGTWDTTQAWCACVATYKEAAGGNPPVNLTADTGTGTAAGTAPSFTAGYTASTGTSTAAGGTTALTVVLNAAGGAATATGGTVSLGGTVNLSASAGTATAAGGPVALSRALTASTGAANATGGATSLTYIYMAAAGQASAGGGLAAASTAQAIPPGLIEGDDGVSLVVDGVSATAGGVEGAGLVASIVE